ncbi:unnamed protein product [Owenia fusiformis]|uniref:Uncharacterized protein n=1 Tax=Owenia fusiformis TaxID=6347 RepID=A0A8J1TMX7_OWEFU|nr:unnamed protein product [Owenia fusiformis]
MTDRQMPVQRVSLHVPPLNEVATVLQNAYEKHYSSVSVNVVDCPDLTQSPFNLAAPGLCGKTAVTDVGGVPNLHPLVDRSKIYSLDRVARQVEIDDVFLVGAGAGPWQTEGVNCEMVTNIKTGADAKNNTHISKVDPSDGSCILKKPEGTDFALMANLFCSQGKPGKVLEIKVRCGTSKVRNFMNVARLGLQAQYGDKPVALGGTFLVEKGKAHIHIMNDFLTTPLDSDEKVEKWLNFYEMSSPLVCLGYLISHDPDLDLRIEHFHCFSEHGEGGHYHWDTTPQEVEYRAYFNVAENIYRIDRPTVSHQIGRD